jgi:hypothetical protein
MAVLPNQRWCTPNSLCGSQSRLTASSSSTFDHAIGPRQSRSASAKNVSSPSSCQSRLPRPAGAKLARVAHRQRRQDHLAHIGRIRRRSPFPIGKEPVLPAAPFLLHYLDRTLPALDLRGVEFAQRQQPSLDDPLRAEAHAFAQRVVDVLLVVFVDDVALQKHVPILPTLGRFA